MLGNEVLAQAIKNAEADVVTCVPGFGGTQVFEAYSGIKGTDPNFSFHEEVAFASAFGAAICGKISVMLTKVHGLAKALNAVTDSLYMSIDGAMLVLVFEDKTGRHSDNIMPAEPLVSGLQLPWMKADAKNAITTLNEAWQKSEVIKNPVYVIFDAEIVDEEIEFPGQNYRPDKSSFHHNLPAHLQVPIFADYQHEVMKARITNKTIESIPEPDIPVFPDDLPPVYAGYMKPYAPLMNVFKDLRGQVVFGDTGISTLFAFPPYNCVDVCAYMGGSVAMAVGAAKAGFENVWAVTGDFSFIAAGHLGLIEAVSKNIPVKILIFKNDRAQTTGSQEINPEMLGKILKGFETYLTEITKPKDETATRRMLKEAAAKDQPQIVIANFNQ